MSTVPESPGTAPVVLLEGVSVRYRVPLDRLYSIKEYAIQWLRRRVKYRDHWALRDIDLGILRGEVVGVIGRNGAGKSTLLRVMARVVFPTAGRVRVWGRVAPFLSLGAGFQQELTGRENIFLNGAVSGYSRTEMAERFDRIVEFAELGEFIDAPLRTYSSGMRARLGFGIATDRRPDVLLLDEVLAVGDFHFRAKCEERMEKFREKGTTTVVVTHAPQLVENICTKAIWLEEGRVHATGEPIPVLKQYTEAKQRLL